MHRERPLQNSMFLPDPNLNRRGSIQYMNSNLNGLKKGPNMPHGLNIGDGFYSPNNTMNVQPNTLNRNYHIEDQKEMPGNRNMEQILNDVSEKLDKITKIVDKHDLQLSSLSIDNRKDEIYKQITNQIKQSMPTITGNNDVYEHIFGLKLEIKNMKEDMAKVPKKIQVQSLEKMIKNLKTDDSVLKKQTQGGEMESFPGKDQLFLEFKKEVLQKRDEHFRNLIGQLESEISFLKKNLQNYTMELKVSPISSNSCILLKYQQIFKAKSKNEADMVINEQAYYIDNEGYLLDCHSRYIVDQKGKKVKLEQKHISMLKSQRILQ